MLVAHQPVQPARSQYQARTGNLARVARSVEVVAEMFREWDAHDLDAVYARLTTDYREYANGMLVKSGPEQARAADAVLYDLIPDYRRTVEELWGVDDRVVSRFVIHGTTANGSVLELPVVCVYGVRDGRISEAHVYFDPATAVPSE